MQASVLANNVAHDVIQMRHRKQKHVGLMYASDLGSWPANLGQSALVAASA
jgi:hypothetical protein